MRCRLRSGLLCQGIRVHVQEEAAQGGKLENGKCVPQHRSGHGSEPIEADARSRLPLRPGCVDLVIHKGCLDAVLNA